MSNRLTRLATLTSSLLLAASSVAFADEPPAGGAATSPDDPGPHADPSQPPMEQTMPAPIPEPGMPVPPPPPANEKKADTAITNKWAATLYGFVEADIIGDSTQGLNDLQGNAAIARPNTYAGDHGQLTYGARNSRIGFKIAAPDYHDVKATAQLEMDFLGNDVGVSDTSLYNNGTFRVRHLNMKVETPIVDVLVGQYWELFGWQSMYHPGAVEIQGVPGQIYSRAPQLRVSKTLKTDAVNVDIAVAAVRPPQRDSATPDGQGGIKVTYNKWKGFHTNGATGQGLDGLSIGVSGVLRRFAVNSELAATKNNQITTTGDGISIDALIPIIRATKDNHDNALTLNGSYVNGKSIADLYTGLSGGVAQQAATTGGITGYVPNVDNGMVEFANDGTLHAIDWESYLIGLQYYPPASTHIFLTANYSHLDSDNAAQFGKATAVFNKVDWFDGNLFYDATPAVRFGLEYSQTTDTYVDGTKATNNRYQFSAFYIF